MGVAGLVMLGAAREKIGDNKKGLRYAEMLSEAIVYFFGEKKICLFACVLKPSSLLSPPVLRCAIVCRAK